MLLRILARPIIQTIMKTNIRSISAAAGPPENVLLVSKMFNRSSGFNSLYIIASFMDDRSFVRGPVVVAPFKILSFDISNVNV